MGPRFKKGRLRAIRVSNHDAVAAEFPFLLGREWNDLPAAYPSYVKPHVFLGSDIAAKSKQVLKDLHIGAVVNAAKELPNYHEADEALSLSYLKLALEDDPLQELEDSIEEA